MVNRDDLRKENKQDMASRQRSRRFVVARNRCVVREEEEGWKKRLKVVAENSSLDHISVHVTHLAEVGAEADQEIIEREALSSPYHLIHPLANQNIMADRRRTNAPAGGTSAPLFVSNTEATSSQRPTRQRSASTPRKIFLQTGLVPSASGSAYLELHPSTDTARTTLVAQSGTLKLTCTVHGPRPLPRTAAFSPNLLLSTHVKFAPFASRQRRGYLRDTAERDLGLHLETALRGVVIGERWPKSAAEVVITVLESEEDDWWRDDDASKKNIGGVGLMNVLAGCVTAASAALVDAGIDCVDLVSGGVAAVTGEGKGTLVLDPCPSEHNDLRAAAVVAHLQSRDELTELWVKGDAGEGFETLIDRAVDAAGLSRSVLAEAVREAAEVKTSPQAVDTGKQEVVKATDVDMTG
jgi:exosome complex component MTR3